MASPLKALGDLKRIQKGGDPTSIRSGHEAAEKVDEALRLIESIDFEGPLRGVESRLMDIQAKLAQSLLGAVQAGLREVVASRKATDLGPVLSKIESIPEADLRPVLDAVASIPQVDLQPVIDAVNAIEMPKLDLTDALLAITGLRQDVREIKFPEIPKTDLSSLEARLAELEKPKEWVFDIERETSSYSSAIKRVTAKAK